MTDPVDLAARTLALAVAVAVLFIGAFHLLSRRGLAAIAGRSGVPVRWYRAVGLLEVAAGVGLFVGEAVTPVGVVAAAGLAALMVAFVARHLRDGAPVGTYAAAAALALLALLAGAARLVT